MKDFKHYGSVEAAKNYYHSRLDNLQYRLENGSRTEADLMKTIDSIQHRLDNLNEQADYYRRSMNHYTDFIMFYENNAGLAQQELDTLKTFLLSFLSEQEFEHIEIDVKNYSSVKSIFDKKNLENAKSWLKSSENVLTKISNDIASTKGLLTQGQERLNVFKAS